jgi:gamma-glutamyltranspeptidase/glutathione hydrolase
MTGWSRELLASDREAASIFLPDGPLVQDDLARTLAELDRFYDGPVAHAAPPPFSPADFAAHRAEWVTPLRASFAGVEVCEMPPNSRGHLALDAIRRLEPLDGLRPDDSDFHLRIVRALHAATVGGDTVYLCVVDERGMAVSVNQSLYMAFGSGVVVPGTGVLLHNRGAYHSAETYRGGARPVHTLAPAMALRDGRPHLVFGTMGGEAQVQIHLQLLARILCAGEPVDDAIAAPRWIFDRSTLFAEDGLPPLAPLPAGLAAATMPVPDMAGHAHAILVEADALVAASDPRADGVALGD